MPKRLVIAISGATGFIYGKRLLEKLHTSSIETHLIISKSAKLTCQLENPTQLKEATALADHIYQNSNIGACIASGSFQTDGMIIAPCSVKTLAEVATGLCSNLISRAADVTLKERRKLVLMVRETPFNLIHLRNMTTVTEAGGIIAPPVPAFYTAPQTLDDLVDHSIGRVMDLFDLEVDFIQRWQDSTE